MPIVSKAILTIPLNVPPVTRTLKAGVTPPNGKPPTLPDLLGDFSEQTGANFG